MAQRHILFVLGMHRSGTSALCAALASRGLAFGPDLLESMSGVNDEGFWEDSRVVELNEAILANLGTTWFNPPAVGIDFNADRFSRLTALAKAHLEETYPEPECYVIKDPRLCITLPLWLNACAAAQINTSACVITRAPLEIAHSLQTRDGFPLGYGLRLYARYMHFLRGCVPEDAAYLTFDALIQDADAALEGLGPLLPKSLESDSDERPVVEALRHVSALEGAPALVTPPADLQAVESIEAATQSDFPAEQTLSEMMSQFVDRAVQLTELGESHSEALQTIDLRDADIAKLDELHTHALATISERDEQIADFDRRLADTGDHLGKALTTLNERDQQLEDMAQQLKDASLYINQVTEEAHEQSATVERLQGELVQWEAKLQRVLETPVLRRLFHRMWYRERS